jgi:hypothetical protein
MGGGGENEEEEDVEEENMKRMCAGTTSQLWAIPLFPSIGIEYITIYVKIFI